MSESIEESKAPPLGSWPRFYALTCVVAATYVVLLWWFTAAFNSSGVGT